MTNTDSDVKIHGTCDERFEAVRKAFAGNFEQGLEVGASAAVTLDGEMVVDLWGGSADVDATDRPWDQDTIVNVWSTTKTMAAICMLMLADRGELDFDAPVAKYWPEFAAAGKEGVLVRNVMGHTSGLSGWVPGIEPADLYDWEKATSILAAQEPLWNPGDGSGYHAITLGYLQGEILRRITGETIGQFFANEVAQPIGADFHIGLDPSHDDRVGVLVPPGPILGSDVLDRDSIAFRSLTSCPLNATEPQQSAWRRAEIPAAGGHGNARSVAAVHAAIACGGSANGVTLCKPETLDHIFEVQSDGMDRVLVDRHLTMGMGMGVTSEATPISPNPRTCYWGGWGGSIGVIDLDARMSVSYVMNRMDPDSAVDLRSMSVVFSAYAALAKLS
jgi:CubicO group peptidase (beta-lactamase class C family)